MRITAELVKQLALAGERRSADFKAEDYDWNGSKKDANSELAKDLMAKANLLGPKARPAYILIGVQNNGDIVGIQTPHLDDAKLQEKVKHILNRVPQFHYIPIVVDGKQVGVYEITPGGRPFYPTKDAGTLQRNVPRIRLGTSTDVPTPIQVQEWGREDDEIDHELRELELEKGRAERRVHGRLGDANMSGSGEGMVIEVPIENTGVRAFDVDIVEWSLEWREAFHAAHKNAPLPEGYVPPRGELQLKRAGRVPPGRSVEFTFRYTRAEAFEHFKQHGLVVEGYNGRWATYHFAVPCKGELGGLETLRRSYA